MGAGKFTVAPGAKVALSFLSPEEKRKLVSVISAPTQIGVKKTAAGHFVSRIGHDKRVLWEQKPGSDAMILSIVDQSYMPA